MRASFFSRQMALHVFVLIWRKGYLTPLYLCLFFFLFTNLFLQIHSIFPPFLKEKNRNKEKYEGFGRHRSIPSVKLNQNIYTVPTLSICSPPVFNMGVKANMLFAP